LGDCFGTDPLMKKLSLPTGTRVWLHEQHKRKQANTSIDTIALKKGSNRPPPNPISLFGQDFFNI
jgi:hypothetical protein